MNFLKRISLTFLLLLVISAISAQSRYKHVPRVKVGENKMVKATKKQALKTPPPVTFNEVAHQSKTEVKDAPINYTEETATASIADQEMIIPTKKTTSKFTRKERPRQEKSTRTLDKLSFTEKVKLNTKLFEVQDVKKTSMETWLLIMIILYVVGFILLVAGIIILLSTGLTLTLLYLAIIFLVLGGLSIGAASLVLRLGSSGVI